MLSGAAGSRGAHINIRFFLAAASAVLHEGAAENVQKQSRSAFFLFAVVTLLFSLYVHSGHVFFCSNKSLVLQACLSASQS